MAGEVWLINDGKKMLVDSGIKFATGLAYRPEQWLLSVAEGHSKWIYSYQINDDGTLANKERFFHLYVADWDDDADAESICHSLEGRQFIATRSGIQISADDGPTQVILPVPDRSRVLGVCLGGKDMDILFAFCGDKVWKRKVQHHAMGAFAPWTKVFEVARRRIPKNSGRSRGWRPGPHRPNSWEFGYFRSKCATSKTKVSGTKL